MANLGRKLGVNIWMRMSEINISPDNFAKHLEYSIKDVWNVIEGKVMVSPIELDKIARLLKTTKRKLIHREPDLQYMKGFSDPDHLDRILDLVDEYVELKEAAS